MHLYEKRPVFRWKGIIITVVLFVAVILLVTLLLGQTGQTADKEQTALLEAAIRNAAVTHYAIEGQYPTSLAQIIDLYGVIVDEDRFLVRYDAFASNVMPTLSVTFKGAYAK